MRERERFLGGCAGLSHRLLAVTPGTRPRLSSPRGQPRDLEAEVRGAAGHHLQILVSASPGSLLVLVTLGCCLGFSISLLSTPL